MRLPQPLLESEFFVFERLEDFLLAIGDDVDAAEISEIKRLANFGLPPVTSHAALATMLGINAGILQAFERRPEKFYRTFFVPKGQQLRKIQAPRIGLKIIQKWLSIALAKAYRAPPHVFGFVQGRSHIDAAHLHLKSRWVFNTDIETFFESTPKQMVFDALIQLGYGTSGASIISNIACYESSLAQGSPLSPVLSNICFLDLDRILKNIADSYGIRFSRYADDLVFSGYDEIPDGAQNSIKEAFQDVPWNLSISKTRLLVFPQRLKVHGLLVHGDRLRLTKGYRNRVRALSHLERNGRLVKDVSVAKGHMLYAEQVSKRL